ncbi:MAG: DUF2723 domain-containing protein [Gammaproteobacteria bacterium]|nr:DUF2723 domain-containing protein [Gammaproteobacteria bacterium]
MPRRYPGKPSWRPASAVLHDVLVFVAVFASYLWSAPRSVVLEDDGFFILAAYFNGAAHPPGYPLYTALAHLATLLPLGSIAFRVHAFTALSAALACLVLRRVATRLVGSLAWGSVSALVFGFSATFWSQSIIAEVYALNVLLFFLLIALALDPSSFCPVSRTRPVFLAGLLYGLSLSNHLPLVLLSSPALFAIYWPHRRQLLRHAPAALIGALCGLAPYAWMIYRTHAVPEFCFFGPIRNWADFWYVISRQAYGDVDFSPSAGWNDKFLYAGSVLRETARQFGTFGWPVSLVGLVLAWRRWPASCYLGFVLACLGCTLAIVLLRDIDYDLFHRNIFRVYPLVAYGVAAIWLGLGARAAVQWADHVFRGAVKKNLLAAALAVLLVGTTWVGGAGANFRAHDDWSAVYAGVLLNSLPQRAVLYANADTVNGPVGYLHWIEGVRPDIRLYSGWYLLVGDQPYRPYMLPPAELEALYERFIGSHADSIFYTNDFPHAHASDDYGLYLRVGYPGEGSASRVIAGPRISAFFAAIARARPPADPWERMHYWRLRADHCRVWGNIQMDSLPEKVRAGDFVPCDHYQGRLLLVRLLLDSGSQDLHAMERLLDEARDLREQSSTKQERAALELLTAEVLWRAGRDAQAAGYFREAARIWPHPENPAMARR